MTECSVSYVADEGATPQPAKTLAEMTTLRVGGPAKRVVVVTSEAEFIDVVTECDDRGEPVLVVGGGSNLLVADEGFDGTVVRVGIMGVQASVSDCGGANLTVGAGENWDQLVSRAVEEQWVGIETLSGIPGSVGASPMQNIGAYGAEVASVISSVRTYDRTERKVRTFANADCQFSYRNSRFKANPGRYLILSVAFQFRLGPLSEPIAYPELARELGVDVGERAPLQQVRDAVLTIRGRKGMVLDESDHDTWSAGSFFMNPILPPEAADVLPQDAPRYPADNGIKTSAAWLIQHAGFERGYGHGPASTSTKHVLALTNRGEAKAADVVQLATEIRAGVEARFGVRLHPEVNLVGTELG